MVGEQGRENLDQIPLIELHGDDTRGAAQSIELRDGGTRPFQWDLVQPRTWWSRWPDPAPSAHEDAQSAQVDSESINLHKV